MKTPYLSQTDREEAVSRIPDWHEVTAIVLERFWFGLAAAAVVFLFTAWRLMDAVPYYRSTAVLMVEASQPRLLNYQDVVAVTVRNLEYFNTVINTLYSRQMMEKALTQSGLADRGDFFPGSSGLSAKAAAALSLVTITAVDKTRLINISAEHPKAEIASELANAMARSYIQQELDNRMTASMQAVEWLRERSVEYREKLEKGMLALQKYREDSQSVSLEEDQNIVIAKLKSLNAALTSAQTERIDAQSKWEAIDKQIKEKIPLEGFASQLEDPVLSETLTRLRLQQQQVFRLRERYKSDHPDLQEALQQEQHLTREFEDAFNVASYALFSRFETLQAREKNLAKALQDQEQEAFTLARALVAYNDLKRNVEADQDIYESVIARMKEASIAETLPTEVIRLAEEARPAGHPYRPRRGQLLLRGALVGVASGIAVIFLFYYADHRFRRNEEVERALGVPVLASLPFIAGQNDRERGMDTHLRPAGEVSESLRTLRAIMKINPSIQKARVILVTSAHPSEGKSLVSTNLAISFAQDDRRTLLLGADLRRPSFKKIFTGPMTEHGLAEVLAGNVAWKDALQPPCIPRLDVLASGQVPSRPAELLGSQAFSGLIESLKSAYDQIVIDAPPILGVSDSLILLNHTGGVLFIVRYGVTHSLGAALAMKRISESGVPCLGVLMNGVDLKSMANYYYYRRYGGYAYHQYHQAPPVPPTVSGAVVGKGGPRSRRWMSALFSRQA